MKSTRPLLVLSIAATALAGVAYFSKYAAIGAAIVGIVAITSVVAVGRKVDRLERDHDDASLLKLTPQEFEASNPDTKSQASEIQDSHTGSDPETGLATYPVFRAILESKVATARRRLWPVTIVQIQLSFLDQISPTREEISAAVVSFSSLLKLTLREADVISRIGNARFALILEDTDEEGSAWVAERIQVAQVKAGSTVIHKISAGVAGYPSNGSVPGELFTRSTMALEHALAAASDAGIGKVVVAPSVPYKA